MGYDMSMMDSSAGGRRCRIEGVGRDTFKEGNEGKTSYSVLMLVNVYGKASEGS
jgi:hypothetical protein